MLQFVFSRVALRSAGVLVAMLLVILAGCASNGIQGPGELTSLKGKIPAEKLFVVDCLLPPQVRKLGSGTTFLERRRPIKTIALDCEIRGGEYVAYDRANYRTALQTWLQQAKAGDPEAQTYVGEIYEKGLGLPADYQTAHLWYQKAARQGFSRAQINLGYLYEQGLGVAKDPVKALNWYRRASGVTDDIDYASTIDVKATVLAEQKTEVYRQQISGLRASLEETRRSLKARSDSLNQATRKMEQLRREVERQKALGANTAQLQRAYDAQRQRVLSDRQAVKKLQSQVVQEQVSLSKPQIEVVAPVILATRSGEPILQVRSGGKAQIIKGKISAPAGLRQATINGRPLTIDSSGLFQSAVPIPRQKTRISIQAFDRQGQKGEFNFFLIPTDKADASPVDSPARVGRVARSVDFGRYYAVVIGNNEYQNFPQLKTAVHDARTVASVLQSKFGFRTRVLTNADRYTILSALNEVAAKMTEKDNLLIYYAGHGEIDPNTQQGYWIPVDADQGNSANWIPNAQISALLNTFTAKHVLVVADSCYSGSMTSRTSIPRLNAKLNDAHLEKWLKLMAKTKSRTVLTAGGLEPVLDAGGGDHSVFANAFLSELRRGQGVLDAYRIFLDVSGSVSRSAAAVGFRQKPTYAPIRHAGHGGGEFMLVSGG